MAKEVIILLSYFGIAFIFALCVFAYQCYEYKKSGTMLRWEYWYDIEKGSLLFWASALFPLTIICGIAYIPFWLIKKRYAQNRIIFNPKGANPSELRKTIVDCYKCNECGRQLMFGKGMEHIVCPACGSESLERTTMGQMLNRTITVNLIDEDN